MEPEYRDAREGDLEGVVRVHLSSFTGFFLSRLGTGFLREYYRLILNNRRSSWWPGTGKTIGFAAGTPLPPLSIRVEGAQTLFALAALPPSSKIPASSGESGSTTARSTLIFAGNRNGRRALLPWVCRQVRTGYRP